MIAWSDVLIVAPELANAASLQSTQAQNVFITDAYAQMNSLVWANQLDRGAKYLAAHLATLSLRRGAAGQISEVGAGAARLGYYEAKTKDNSNPMNTTSYGQEWLRIGMQLPAARLTLGGMALP